MIDPLSVLLFIVFAIVIFRFFFGVFDMLTGILQKIINFIIRISLFIIIFIIAIWYFNDNSFPFLNDIKNKDPIITRDSSSMIIKNDSIEVDSARIFEYPL